MAILLFVHLTRHSSTANEQLSCISLVPEIGTPGLMRMGNGALPHGPSNRAHPRLYHFRRFDVASYSAGARDLNAERRSAACLSVSDVKAMSPT
jgi:hypothetical protein